ncbi:MAG: glycosyl transferase family 2 [Phycisphaerales bacterium]|nr:glycosyl transferase family 2 [Phycisphaerales bacterium]
MWVNVILFALAALLLVPVIVLCIECFAALFPRRPDRQFGGTRPRLAILIPAHNEECVLGATLTSLMPQLHAADRVVVVADNCDDATTAIGRRFGVEVIERKDVRRRGKGYALDYGVRHLEGDAPGIVVMMDADCHVHPGAIDALVGQVMETGKPAQAVYLLERPARPGPKDLVSALAFMVKNLVRPSGLGRLGLPCLLTGTGMAFPWHVIRTAKMATGNLVEDLQLGLDLALAGHAPLFCEQARVTGKLPSQRRAAISQRRRWEHGHLQTLFTQVPRLIHGAIRRRSLSAFSLALEVAVPPLSLLVLLFVAAIIGSIVAARHGASWIAPNLLLAGAAAAMGCIAAAWLKFGRQHLPLMSLLAAPFYVVWKIPLYLAFVFRPQREWVRTERCYSDTFDDAIGIPELLGGEPFPAMQQPSIIDLCGVNIHALTERQCIAQIMRRSTAGRGGVVITPNLDHLRRCHQDSEFARLVSRADLVVADGMPLIWASRLQCTPLPGRVAGSDLLSSLSATASKMGKTLFLLGGDPGTADSVAGILRNRYPGLKIAGTYCPPMGFQDDPERMRELTRVVVSSKPDIVFVALGSPKQERLIERLRDRLPGAWWLGVGISFSFLAGNVRRAPHWMRTMGLEWVHRLVQEPVRLFKRYLMQGIPFAMRLLGTSAWRGLTWRMGFTRAAPALTVRMASAAGMGSVDLQISEADLMVASRSGRGSRNPSEGNARGQETTYRSFLSGFASEFWVPSHEPQPRAVQVAPADPDPLPADINVPDMLRGVRAIILLGGAVRTSKLTAAIERSILDLPLEDGRSILGHWQDEAGVLRRMIGADRLAVRVIVDHASAEPTPPEEKDAVQIRVERDSSSYRGTGGVLRDLATQYADEDVLLVANAGQALLSPLAELARSLAELEGDVSLISHADGTPSGLMLVRCRALRKVSQTGYVDMKEQALPAIARDFKVSHLYQTHATAMPIRTLEEYIAALQRRHRVSVGHPPSSDPFAEDHRPTFAIAEAGAEIDPDARVHDSVVLAGAVVEAGAVVVRSIVCPGGMLAEGETAIDSLVMNTEVAAR